MTNSVQNGKSFDYTVGEDEIISSGDLVAVGNMVGVSYNDGIEGDLIAISLCGVYECPKVTGSAIAIGDRLYFKADTGNLTKTASGNVFAGFAWTAQLSADTTVQILLVQGDAAGDSGFVQGAEVEQLAGTLTGSTDGTLANVAAIALSTSNTYTDAAVNTAVNTAITATNLQLKELQVKLNELIGSLTTGGILAS